MTDEILNVDEIQVDADGMIVLSSPSGGVAVVDEQVFYKQYEGLLNEEMILQGRLVENQYRAMKELGISE